MQWNLWTPVSNFNNAVNNCGAKKSACCNRTRKRDPLSMRQPQSNEFRVNGPQHLFSCSYCFFSITD